MLMMVSVWSGCGGDSPTQSSSKNLLVGVWSTEEEGVTITFTFYQDSTYRHVFFYSENDDISFTRSGTWSLKNDFQLEIDEVNITFNERWLTLVGVPPYDWTDEYVPIGKYVYDISVSTTQLITINADGFRREYIRQ